MILFHFATLFSRMLWEGAKQWLIVRRDIHPLLQPCLKGANEAFSPKEGKRIRFYATLIPTLAASSYALLANVKLRPRERALITKLSAATPLVDDHFDDPNLSSTRLKDLITSPESCTAQNDREALLLTLLRAIRSETTQAVAFNALSEKVYDAQLVSKRQRQAGLSQEEYKQITFDKGGYSTLLYHALVEHPEVSGADKALYHLGGMMQYMDDLFDVYEDVQAGIRTMVTETTDIRLLQRDFDVELGNLHAYFEALPLPLAQIKRYRAFLIVLFAMGSVCLDQLLLVQEAHGGVFRAAEHERKLLICDMALFSNQFAFIGKIFKA